MTHPFEFGAKVAELDAPTITMTVTGFRYFGPSYVEVSCTRWQEGELLNLMIPAWRLVEAQ